MYVRIISVSAQPQALERLPSSALQCPAHAAAATARHLVVSLPLSASMRQLATCPLSTTTLRGGRHGSRAQLV